MTVDGMSFSRFIRTIAPGLLIVIVLAGYLDAGYHAAGNAPPFISLLLESPVASLSFALVAALFAGALSNMAVFMWVNDLLVRRHFERTHTTLFNYQVHLDEVIRSRTQASVPDNIIDFDPLYLVMPKVELQKWQFLEDSYWSYLEFQLNLFIGAALALPLALWGGAILAVEAGHGAFWQVLAGTGALGMALVLCRFLVAGARYNYVRLIRKRISYLTALLLDDDPRSFQA